MFRYTILFCILLTLSAYGNCFAQNEKTIDSLETKYQACLDEGKNMLDCSKSFYKVMDSMLNIVYFKIAAKLDSNHKIQLRNEQRSWLTSRNVYFKMTLNKFKQKHPGKSPLGNSSGAQDDAMIMHDENAQFVKERILALLKRTFN
ncbi:DUF1311 domain-containing protein [Lacibacter luteus]|uniref:DUF1311 domain-containing protein n=2 Tax=Lacibacter luteus TaxID=2508719 RepID=A0A4Q1CLR6_9BACT|nr:DUF1311 domain-containing protein [Lacibacter luteus]